MAYRFMPLSLSEPPRKAPHLNVIGSADPRTHVGQTAPAHRPSPRRLSEGPPRALSSRPETRQAETLPSASQPKQLEQLPFLQEVCKHADTRSGVEVGEAEVTSKARLFTFRRNYSSVCSEAPAPRPDAPGATVSGQTRPL
ncbi:hypothetical protein AAFF_G00329910 [Aldrovandia affinis]|uniref:Uncharacterized protein n=1 Tax=Aldrovandia affinis TaxID=143900 RepID=A0AAD7SMA7_9TELE|nr:hypothetical protein AAFF_G00329910 [Aldrovandia affinis]